MSTDANTKALEDSLTEFPNAKVADEGRVRRQPDRALNKILNILYVLLALSVIVSLFGIVNTLVLTVFERTRELGMLRAIGMTRRQVRRMIRHESVITALIGGTLGIVLGIVLGGLLIARVDFIVFALPVVQLVVFAIATDLRRHPRRDLPGPPRGEARPARGAPVRVGLRGGRAGRASDARPLGCSATAAATAGATSRLKTLGMT